MMSATMTSVVSAQGFNFNFDPQILDLDQIQVEIPDSFVQSPVTACNLEFDVEETSISIPVGMFGPNPGTKTINMASIIPEISYMGNLEEEVTYRLTYLKYDEFGELLPNDTEYRSGQFTTQVSPEAYVPVPVVEDDRLGIITSESVRRQSNGGVEETFNNETQGVYMLAHVDNQVCQASWGMAPERLEFDFSGLQDAVAEANADADPIDPNAGNFLPSAEDFQIDPDVLIPADPINPGIPIPDDDADPEFIGEEDEQQADPRFPDLQVDPDLAIDPDDLRLPERDGGDDAEEAENVEPSFASCQVTGQALQEGNNVRIQALVRYDDITVGDYRYKLALEAQGIEGADVYDGEIMIIEPTNRGYVANGGQPFEFAYNVAETGNVFELSASMNNVGCRGLEIVVAQAVVEAGDPPPPANEDIVVDEDAADVVVAQNANEADQDELAGILAALEELNEDGNAVAVAQEKPRRVSEEEADDIGSEQDDAMNILLMVLGVVVGALLVLVIVLLVIMQKHKRHEGMMQE